MVLSELLFLVLCIKIKSVVVIEWVYSDIFGFKIHKHLNIITIYNWYHMTTMIELDLSWMLLDCHVLKYQNKRTANILSFSNLSTLNDIDVCSIFIWNIILSAWARHKTPELKENYQNCLCFFFINKNNFLFVCFKSYYNIKIIFL